MLDRMLTALVAVSMAFLVWLYARSRDQEVLDNIPVPVQVNVPAAQADEYSLEVSAPGHVYVSFVGPPSRIKELRSRLHRGELQVKRTLAVVEARLEAGRLSESLRIEPSDLQVPPGVTPLLVEGRDRVTVTLHRLTERWLPVRWHQALGEVVPRVQVEPATVLVRGPEEVLDRARSIACVLDPGVLRAWEQEGERLRDELPGGAGPYTVSHKVPLVQELHGRGVQATPAAVTVSLHLPPRRTIHEIEVPIHFLCPVQYTMRPSFPGDGRQARATLRLEGPAGEGPNPAEVLAFVDLTRRNFEPGPHREPLQLQLPKDFQLVEEQTRRVVSFRIDPPETAAVEHGEKDDP